MPNNLTHRDKLLATRRTMFVNCTEPGCGRPLYEKLECRTGICASCRHKAQQCPRTATERSGRDLIK